MSTDRTRRVAREPARLLARSVLLALALLVVPGALAACGHHHHDDFQDRGNVFVANRTPVAGAEDILSFHLAPFGEPFTGNLLSNPVLPGETRFAGTFREDFYDAFADMSSGDLVEWFDVFVGNGDDVFFEVF